MQSMSTMGMGVTNSNIDMDRLFRSEKDNLELMSYDSALDAVEKNVLKLHGHEQARHNIHTKRKGKRD